MRKGLSEYEIEGHVARLRRTLIFQSDENGRGIGGGDMDGALGLGLGWVINAGRASSFQQWEAQLQGYTRGVDDLGHIYIGVASRQRHGTRRSEGRGGVSRLLEADEVAGPGRSGPPHVALFTSQRFHAERSISFA
jgi:hypothetical protein